MGWGVSIFSTEGEKSDLGQQCCEMAFCKTALSSLLDLYTKVDVRARRKIRGLGRNKEGGN